MICAIIIDILGIVDFKRSCRRSTLYIVDGQEDRYEMSITKGDIEENENKRNRWNLLLAISVILFALASIAVYMAPQMLFRVYSDEEEFQNRADQKFRSIHVLPEAGRRVISYDYSDTAATAIRYDASYNEDMAVFRDQRIKTIQKSFRDRISEDESLRKKKEGDELLYRPLQHVLLIDTAFYDTGTGAYTLAIYTEEYAEKDKTMEIVDSSIDTWLLSSDDMRSLKPVQIMTPEYREKAAVFVKEYLRTTYDEKKHTGNEANYIADQPDNFNKFVISSNNVTFFFDPGTVIDSKEGVISVSMLRSYMGPTVRPRVIDRYIDPTKPMVALTYDDGPGGKEEQRILNCLKKYHAVATFFYVGNRVKGDKGTVKMAYDMGCEIGNHSWDHSDMTTISKDEIKKQIKKTNEAISKVTGVRPSLFRPPYGAVNEKVLEYSDMPSILWKVDTLDWKSRDPEKIFKKVKKNKKLDGKIILMHSIYDETAEATEEIVPWLLKNGYQLVTVTELIKYKTGEAPKAKEVYE